MKKHKILSALLVVLLLAAMVPAQAAYIEDETAPPYFTGLVMGQTSIDIGTLGKATCTASVQCREGYTMDVTLSLQENDGSGWSTLRSWSKSGTPIVNITESYYVNTNYSHRTCIYVEVSDSNGNFVESAVAYSSVV